jgi:hypothetical protein
MAIVGRLALTLGGALSIACGPGSTVGAGAGTGSGTEGGPPPDLGESSTTAAPMPATDGDATPPEGESWLLAYKEDHPNGPDVHIVRVWESGDVREEGLLEGPPLWLGWPEEAFWSPTGDALLTASWEPDSTRFFVWSTDGVIREIELPGSPASLVPAWSPTGDAFAVSRSSDLFVVDLRGASPAATSLGPGQLCAWAGDGTHVFFQRDWKLRAVELDRAVSGLPVVAETDLGIAAAVCNTSADGQAIFARDGAGAHALSLSDDPEPTVVATMPAATCDPLSDFGRWAPNERLLALEVWRVIDDSVGLCELPFRSQVTVDVWSFDLREGGPPGQFPALVPVVTGNADSWASALGWAETASGGSRLAVVAPDAREGRVIRVVELNDDVVDVAVVPGEWGSLAPDGEHLVYRRGAQLLLASMDTGDTWPIGAHLVGESSQPTCTWSPNGTHAACSVVVEGEGGAVNQLWSITPGDGDPHMVVVNPAIVTEGKFSPDAQMLGYLESFPESRLHLVPFDEAGPRLDARSEIEFAGTDVRTFTWQP